MAITFSLLILATFSLTTAPVQTSIQDVPRLLAEEKFDQALQILDDHLVSFPSDDQAKFTKGLALSALRRWQDAYAVFNDLAKRSPALVLAPRNAAIAAYELERYPEAERLLREYLKREANDDVAQLYLGRSLFRQGDYTGALSYFSNLTQLSSRDPWFGLELAEAELRSGSRQSAIGRLQRMASPDVHFAFRVASLLVEAEAYGPAIERFTSIRRDYPDRTALDYNLALAHFRSGQLVQALALLERLEQERVMDGDVLSLMAALYRDLRRPREAYNSLQKAIFIEPERVQHYVDLLSLCIEMENYEDGLEIAELALRQHPNTFELYAQRGILLSLRGQTLVAANDFRRALKLHPGHEGLTIGLALALIQGDRLDEARAVLTELLPHSRHYLGPYLMAEVLMRGGLKPDSPEEQTAIESLRKSLQMNEGHAEARLLLARILRRKGLTEPAKEQLEIAIRLQPRHRDCYYELYRLEMASGNTARAAELAKQLDALQKGAEAESWQHAFFKEQMRALK